MFICTIIRMQDRIKKKYQLRLKVIVLSTP